MGRRRGKGTGFPLLKFFRNFSSMYLGESNTRTVVPRVVYDHPVRTDKFIRCSGKVFSLLNSNLRCGLEKGHDGRHKKILEPKKRWESILPPLPEGQGTDSGYIIHGVVYPSPAPETKKFSDMTLAEKYSQGILERLIPEIENDPEHPDKPYIVEIELRVRNLEDAKAQAIQMAAGDGLLDGRVVYVVQKYRMTNVGTEWYNPEKQP